MINETEGALLGFTTALVNTYFYINNSKYVSWSTEVAVVVHWTWITCSLNFKSCRSQLLVVNPQ